MRSLAMLAFSILVITPIAFPSDPVLLVPDERPVGRVPVPPGSDVTAVVTDGFQGGGEPLYHRSGGHGGYVPSQIRYGEVYFTNGDVIQYTSIGADVPVTDPAPGAPSCGHDQEGWSEFQQATDIVSACITVGKVPIRWLHDLWADLYEAPWLDQAPCCDATYTIHEAWLPEHRRGYGFYTLDLGAMADALQVEGLA